MSKISIYLVAGIISFYGCQDSGEQEGHQHQNHQTEHEHAHQGHSPYAGQQKWDYKAFPPKVVKQLEKGSGMPFYGMAKPAELNSYPGPKHILQGKQQLDLSKVQQEQIQAIYDNMHRQAKVLGDSLLANEQKIEAGFAQGLVNRKTLKEWINRSGALYGELRFVHLQAHLKAKKVLDEEQIQRYNKWRGYR